jgi:hypothetical protein
MSLLGHGLFAAAMTRGALLDRRSLDPRPSQLATLRALLRRAHDTSFGREHGFAKLRDVSEFRAHVPLRDYAALLPWLSRAIAGEANVIWPGTIPYFGMSSGTTGGNKYLPISSDFVRCQRRSGFDPIAAYVRTGGRRDVLDGKAILLGSTPQLERRASGVLVGDNTGIMARHMPRFIRHKHLPSPKVRALANWDRKIEALALEAVDRDVRLIAGTPAWFTGLFDEVLRVARRRNRPADRILDVWPHLRLLTGGGVRYEPYRSLIEARVGGYVPYVDVYNATEGGIMGVQDRPNDPAMRLLPDNGVFFEFIPIETLANAAPERLSLWDVERDHTYALALTTPSGLFGYMLGDCVRFVSTFPHRFLFQGRTSAFLNACGEHVSQGELERAVSVACAEQALSLVDFTVNPRTDQPPPSAAEHVYFLECEGRPTDAGWLARTIDSELAAGNEDYRVHREAERGIARPRVELLARGSFTRWMRERGKLGGQHKVPRVIEDPQLAAALIAASRAGAPPEANDRA